MTPNLFQVMHICSTVVLSSLDAGLSHGVAEKTFNPPACLLLAICLLLLLLLLLSLPK